MSSHRHGTHTALKWNDGNGLVTGISQTKAQYILHVDVVENEGG